MHDSSNWLQDFKSNIYSQGGEDGIIKKALDTLPTNDKWCVEFGAWDGLHLSNTRNLIENYGYNAVAIEGNSERYNILKKNYEENKQVIGINAFVGFSESDGLDTILAGTSIPENFDFLSIDIDGNDYHAWKAMHRYAPKLVCIEFNPTIHTDIDFVQRPDPSINHGASLSALVRLGKEKNYELICVLPLNAIFIHRDFFDLFQISDNSPINLRIDTDHVTHIFAGYDGTVFLRGNSTMLWHGISLKESRCQQIPSFLRSYPGNYNLVQRMIFKLFRLFL